MADPTAPSPAPSLMDSSRAVLRVLAASGPITRPRLGAILDLSKPTMSAAVSELSAAGLVTAHGSHKGATGRTATIYGLGPAAGYVVGIDVGAAQVRAVAHSLDDRPLATVEQPIPRPSGATVDEIGEVIDSVARATILAVGGETLRSVAVAVPRIVSTQRLGQRKGPEAVLRQLRARIDAPILLENNVNCAAIAEHHYGAARNHDVFSYLQVGVRIGLGIIVNGRLLRGFNGAAGEIGRLPFPWSPHEIPTREGLEHYLGSAALVERCAADWPEAEGLPPASAKELFARAEAGSETALLWVARHAADIGRLVAGCVGMLDPGLIVLGGGVGQNPLMLREVRRVAKQLTWPTEIAVSALGAHGTVLGAMRLAADHGLGQILGENRHPAVVLPPLDPTGDSAAAE
ncbi:putative NBD/HSP70 family sugar kinase [Inquilinus ginsengisoli]|uniref:NBD/HSP70 family sugar kinase n=1 Tax=Inquilinus ginsengisoli TaxID=363840 RepID=A0ABU1JKS2_9PROT|nr:ROK family transcriptional regulator [Inquilinus ginsengisoli]MDR6289190.1 putative NBD/HSP70 family sugar kinase [Inquilinus ginsengisoli]